ncbi:MAG: amidotransferase 1, exosortase A system-associated [Thalassobaculales bacterium]
MCGIAGVLRLDDGPPVEAGLLDRLNAAQAARGPDGEGRWIDAAATVGLAHRRLAVIDTGPAAAQPMLLDGGRLAITFNGEIYNHAALRAELVAAGERFATASDTEVLLRLYLRDGPAMVERLQGMFAFALWDSQRRGLLLARDPLGMKPLYVARMPGRLAFASRARALAAGLGLDGGDGAACPAGLAGFLLFGAVPEPFTLWPAIRAVPAGCTLWLAADRSAMPPPRRYFDLGAVLAAAAAQPAPDAGAVREAVLGCVRRHLVADVPVGLFLSGGVDSATLLAAAAELGPPPACLTLGFAGPGDETAAAAALAARHGARHQVERVTGEGFRAASAEILAAMDLPSIDGVNTWLIARAAARQGWKVALSGLGGDELCGGYASFRQVPRLAALLRPLAAVPGLPRLAGRLLGPLLASLLGAKGGALPELGVSLPGAYLLRRGLFMPAELPGLIGAARAREGLGALDPLGRLSALAAAGRGGFQQVRLLEYGWYLQHQLLRDADWAGMAHGVEIRPVLADPLLLAALAPLLMRPGAFGKRALAATVRPPLPAAVTARPKQGFALPLATWRGERNLRGWALAVLSHFTGAAMAGGGPPLTLPAAPAAGR